MHVAQLYIHTVLSYRTLYIGIAYGVSILPYLRKFQFSLSVSNVKVKITIKINPYQKFGVVCVQY